MLYPRTCSENPIPLLFSNRKKLHLREIFPCVCLCAHTAGSMHAAVRGHQAVLLAAASARIAGRFQASPGSTFPIGMLGFQTSATLLGPSHFVVQGWNQGLG